MIELQNIDCNCNDCVFMVRNLAKKKLWDDTELHNDQKNASHRIHYGDCSKFNKPVSFIPNTFQNNTQGCFKHRRETT